MKTVQVVVEWVEMKTGFHAKQEAPTLNCFRLSSMNTEAGKPTWEMQRGC